MSNVNGNAVIAIAAGTVFVWAGAKGYSVLKAVQNITTGNAAGTGQSSASLLSVDQSETGVATSAPPANASESAWIKSLLSALSAPDTAANESSLTNWIARETPWPPVSANNPLNTTQVMGGSHSVNSVGVQAYPSASVGITATVTTLENGFYPAIVAALRAGTGLAGCGPWNSELSSWSGGGYSSV
jgi:hypothetical protein